MLEGWKCPSCKKSHGPHVDTCPEVVVIDLNTTSLISQEMIEKIFDGIYNVNQDRGGVL